MTKVYIEQPLALTASAKYYHEDGASNKYKLQQYIFSKVFAYIRQFARYIDWDNLPDGLTERICQIYWLRQFARYIDWDNLPDGLTPCPATMKLFNSWWLSGYWSKLI